MIAAFRVIFLAAFLAGLVLAVFSMLHGVEHARRKRNRTRAPSPFFNLPALAAFAFGLGLTGYLIASHTALPAWAVILIAFAGGAVVMTGMITLLARWALRGASSPATQQPDEIQGQPAIVTREISLGRLGEISYHDRGASVTLAARGLDTRTLPAGTEVAIDRIEAGVAFVEEWAVVERRL